MENIAIEYEPFGELWEKELKKTPKSFIIEQYKRQCIKVLELQNADQVKLTMLLRKMQDETGYMPSWNEEKQHWQ